MIKTQALCKTFYSGFRRQKIEALKGIDLEVKKGEIFGFLGPNGAGKTTTIKILAGLLRPTSGSASIAGYDLASDGLHARTLISYVPDEPFLYEKLTAREFLRLIGELYGMPPDKLEARIDEVVRLFELSEFLDHLTEGYSHGMKQRTVIAAALLHEPRVLVVDEPMVGLDPRSVRKVKDTLNELSRNQKMTVFMSTHTLSMAEESADRIGILNNGKLIAVGTLPEIKACCLSATGQDKERLEDIFLHLTA